MESFAGRTAVVTGAASGIGLAMAERFASEGMNVVLADIEEAALASADAKLRESGATTLAVQTDVSQWESVDALAGRAFERFGAVHVLCNNAGVTAARVQAGSMWRRSLDDWEWILGVNLWGVVHGVRAFLPRMLERGEEAHIVNTASIAGVLSLNSGIYGVSKRAVVALSESLRDQLAARRAPVRVSALCPGVVNTNILDAERNRPERLRGPDRAGMTDDERAEDDAARGRLEAGMSPSEIADAVIEGIRARRFFIIPLQDEHRSPVADGLRSRTEKIIEAFDRS